MNLRLAIFALLGLAYILPHSACSAQQLTERNVILITLDGLRSEEVFTGADQRLITKDNGVEDPKETMRQYWREDKEERRRALLPFLWSKCKSGEGWIAGDANRNSRVSVSNGLFFSYPGYSELLCGFADPRILSNDKKYNASTTVLEWLHQLPEFQGKVAAYTSWDVFPYIINDKRSGVPVNAGWMPLTVGDPTRLETLNLVADQLFHQWPGVRYDVLTTAGALEEIRARRPRVLYVSLGETDDWAHEGKYGRYLLSAKQNDEFIRMLWTTTQGIESYRDKTLFIVTSDHGRGDGREGWKSHGITHPGSDRIWIAAFGAGLEVSGEDQDGTYVQAQVASTVAAFLGHDFTRSDERVHKPLPIVKPE
jgi:hypothetical protein